MSDLKLKTILAALLTVSAPAFADGASPSGLFGNMAIWVVLAFVVFFILIRPEQKRKKEMEKMRVSLEKGDSIRTIGGIHGKIENVDSSKGTATISTAGSKIEIYLTAIQNKVIEAETAPNPEELIEAK